MTEIEKKTGMTDAECERLDKYYTENTFTPGPNLLKQGIKPGFAWKTPLNRPNISSSGFRSAPVAVPVVLPL
ncbi:hypothetical protein FACS1894147_04320 [Spirochaetia bacterium]|nr:hypothetical protein FACS1894147_04320 [Spirochaetia bacterium]